MGNYSVYEDIASRTNGDIYIGVVGPVRTGKSTFIKRFMEKLVLPVAAAKEKAVMTDELPQSAAGKTVMTTEPKFVPAKSAKIKIGKNATAKVRLVDCVGFAVEGAGGFEEDGKARLVKTPWSETPLPFEEAAATGTQKVIRDHSTIGILMTTDGSIAEIPRSAYVPAEEKTAAELKAIGKPYVILLNCKEPENNEALRASLQDKYGVPVLLINAENLDENSIHAVMEKLLFEFPVRQIDIALPDWMQSLPEDSPIIAEVMKRLREKTPSIKKMKDCLTLENLFAEGEKLSNKDGVSMDLGTGKTHMGLDAKEGLFYSVLSEECGETIDGDFRLMQYVRSLSDAKKNYDKIKDALSAAEESGYGMVSPTFDDMQLETPKLVKRGSGYGVKFRASAPSYHIIKIDVSGEVNPIIGTQEQGTEFVREKTADMEESAEKVWDTNIFGKNLKELLSSELYKKTDSVPFEVRKKMRKTITRIVNEGKGGVICILL